MSASPQIVGVPVEVYLRSSYEPDAEYVRLEPLPAEAFDLPKSRCRFDLKEIEKLLD